MVDESHGSHRLVLAYPLGDLASAAMSPQQFDLLIRKLIGIRVLKVA